MKRRVVVTAGLAGAVLVGTAIGVANLSAASGAPQVADTAATAAAPPCTSAAYTLDISLTSSTGTVTSTSVTGQVDFSSDALTANLTLPSSLPIPGLAGADLQLVLVGGTAYVEVPPALSSFVNGATWVSIALPSKLNSAIDGFLARGASWCANPQSLVANLSRGSSQTSLGTSTIGNQSASGVKVQQTGRRINRALKLPPSIVKSAGLGGLGGSQLPIEVWTGPQGQLAQVGFSTSSVSATLTLTDVDQLVPIAAPSGAVPLSPSYLKLLGGL